MYINCIPFSNKILMYYFIYLLSRSIKYYIWMYSVVYPSLVLAERLIERDQDVIVKLH